MAEVDDKSLLSKFKLTIGDLTPSSDLDDYYNNFLNMATADLLADDIDETVLNTELGSSAVVLYANALMRGEDVATNPTLNLLKNTLSVQTKGIRNADGN